MSAVDSSWTNEWTANNTFDAEVLFNGPVSFTSDPAGTTFTSSVGPMTPAGKWYFNMSTFDSNYPTIGVDGGSGRFLEINHQDLGPLLHYYFTTDPDVGTIARTEPTISGMSVVAGNGSDPPAATELGKIDLISQTANIGTTNLSNAPPAGLYLVEVYLACTTAAVGAGTLTVTLGWTDVVGAITSTPITGFVLTATGRTTGRQLMQVTSGEITYAVAVTGIYSTAAYAVYVRVIALG